MSKRSICFILTAMVVGVAVMFLVRWYAETRVILPIVTETELRTASLKLGGAVSSPPQAVMKPVSWEQPIRLAIGSLGITDDLRNQQIADLVAVELSGAKGIDLVERRELEAVLREQRLSLSGLVRASDAVRIGKLLRADWFLLGTAVTVRGTNCLVVRIVDARTGIMRDGEVLMLKAIPAVAADLGKFVRTSREAAAEAKTPVYMAIGSFEDMSVNNRQAELRNQLRGYLTAAYQHSEITLLERDYVEVLLDELRLDLAGLTEDVRSSNSGSAQSAFWLVEGAYQSYETTNLQIELTLRVQRIFGRNFQYDLRGVSGEPLLRSVKETIDNTIHKNAEIIVPTRVSEARAQRMRGKDLAGFDETIPIFPGGGDGVMDNERATKRHSNLEEAIRAFRTVLLLEPTNREVKMYLAACVADPLINRMDEARNYYRELIEQPNEDKLSGLARYALLQSFRRENPNEAALFFSAAINQTANSNAAQFYFKQARLAEANATIKEGGPKAEQIAEERLVQSIESFGDQIRNHEYHNDTGMDAYVSMFKTNKALAAQRVADLLPKLKSRFPELEPHLLAQAVSYQQETNTPLVTEFRLSLSRLSERPAEVLEPRAYWELSKEKAFNWAFRCGLYDIAAEIMKGKLRIDRTENEASVAERNQDRICLAYSYLRMNQWTNALQIFEAFSNQPVRVGIVPWGPAFSTISTAQGVAYCRKQLGISGPPDPLDFAFKQFDICLCSRSAFAVTDDGAWLCINGKLLELDFDLKTNRIVSLPNNVLVTCMSVTRSNVWIGTDGDGLLDYDQTTHKFGHLGERDGLLMDKISSLHISRETLWIGYGRTIKQYDAERSDGGLGKLDLATRISSSFTPDIRSVERGGIESPDKPTRLSVMMITDGAAGDIWFVTDESVQRLRRYRTRNGTWEGGTAQVCTGIASNSKQLVEANYWGGVTITDFQTETRRRLDELPQGSPTTVALNGNDLWVGGVGYVAVVSLPDGKLRKRTFISAGGVDQIQFGGGYAWIQFNQHLHRIALSEL